MRRNIIHLAIIFIFLYFIIPISYSLADNDIYTLSQASSAAKSGQIDFAFMQYRELLKENPKSRYTKAAIFAHGEYYYTNKMFAEGVKYFEDFLKISDQKVWNLFTKAFLYNYYKNQKDTKHYEQLKKEIITFKRFSLIFRDHIAYTIESPLANKYKALYYINKVEFYINDKLFEKISF